MTVRVPVPATVPAECVIAPPTVLVLLRTSVPPLTVRLLAKTEAPEIVKGPPVTEMSALSVRLLIVWFVDEEIVPIVIVTPTKVLLIHTTSVEIGRRARSQLLAVVH